MLYVVVVYNSGDFRPEMLQIYMHLPLLQSWLTVRCDRRFLNTRRILDKKGVFSIRVFKGLPALSKLQTNQRILVKAAALLRTGICPNICCQQLKLHSIQPPSCPCHLELLPQPSGLLLLCNLTTCSIVLASKL